jgi:hypothetical protein
MGLGGFFRKFLGLLPFIGKLLDNPIVRTILIMKIGEKWIRIIEMLIDTADRMDVSNPERHSFVSIGLTERGINIPNSELDTLISGMVAAKRNPESVKVVFEEDEG